MVGTCVLACLVLVILPSYNESYCKAAGASASGDLLVTIVEPYQGEIFFENADVAIIFTIEALQVCVRCVSSSCCTPFVNTHVFVKFVVMTITSHDL